MKTQSTSQAAYDTFIGQVKSQQVQQVTIRGRQIEYQLKSEFGGQNYKTTRIQPQADCWMPRAHRSNENVHGNQFGLLILTGYFPFQNA